MASEIVSGLTEATRQLVDQWLHWDTNADTIKEIQQLVDEGNESELKNRLATRIKFGTAGLRAKMQAGSAYMNHLTVQQASQGLVRAIEQVFAQGNAPSDVKKAVCIGHDARHHSAEFALITASAFLSVGIPVYFFREIVPTPLVAFSVKELGLAGGVMITASHNPKDDNGYKVYWQKGTQIVSPVDAQIAAAIEQNLEPWVNVNHDIDKYCEITHTEDGEPLLRYPLPDIANKYYQKVVKECCFHPELNKQRKKNIVYTPMHGVGKFWLRRMMESFSHPPCVEVEEQVEPNPDFPTVPFPNPEEGQGALKLAIETAERVGAPLIIANDPDADRFAAAERLPSGEWKIFTGNEIGTLLAHWMWTQYKEAHPDVLASQCVFINTTVSSKMLKAIADVEGIEYHETLTGFKWLGSLATQKIKEGKIPLLCYEEAIGYLLRDICFDKDGVSAAGTFVEMFNYLDLKHSRTLTEQLNELAKKYGHFVTINSYFFCYDPSKVETIFKRIRGLGKDGKFAYECGGFPIRSIRDLTIGYDDDQPDKKPILYVSTSSQMITFYFENGAVVTLRGSGTEPKLKYYCELNGSDPVAVRETLSQVVKAVIAEYLQPEANGLVPPAD